MDRNPRFKFIVQTYSHYSECEPWLEETVGKWSEVWWRDFPDIAMSVALGEVPQPDRYWFLNEKDAIVFKLKFA